MVDDFGEVEVDTFTWVCSSSSNTSSGNYKRNRLFNPCKFRFGYSGADTPCIALNSSEMHWNDCCDDEENGCDMWQQSMSYHTIIITVIIQHALLVVADGRCRRCRAFFEKWKDSQLRSHKHRAHTATSRRTTASLYAIALVTPRVQHHFENEHMVRQTNCWDFSSSAAVS